MSSRRRQLLAYSAALVGAVAYPSKAALANDAPSSPTSQDSPATRASKPFAPTSALLPAIRAKLWIEDAHNLAQQLVSSSNESDTTTRDKTLQDLNYVLSHRPKLFDPSKGEKPLSRVSSTAFAQFTAKKGSDKLLDNTVDNGSGTLFSASLSPGDRLAAAFNRADVGRQWGMLQSQESKKEQENEVRAAFNFYTQQLEFNSNSYAWNGSVAERKRRIRDDQIPTPTSVITSDLDLRDLYRNQLLTALDDVTAEVDYQFRQLEEQRKGSGTSNAELDLRDTTDLMNQAYVACTKWFDMIDERDIKSALDIVRQGDL